MSFWGWVEEKASAVGNFVSDVKDSVAKEAVKAVTNPGDWIAGNAVDFAKGMWESAQDVVKNPKGFLKGAADYVGFIPVLGDAIEVGMHFGAGVIGVCQNPSNWQGELAEFAGEAAIALIPGPAIIAKTGFKAASKATQGFAAVYKSEGKEAVIKQALEVAVVKTPINLIKKAPGGAAIKTAEHAIMPGVGTAAKHSLKDTYKATTALTSDLIRHRPGGKGGRFGFTKDALEDIGTSRMPRKEARQKLMKESLPADNKLAKEIMGASTPRIDKAYAKFTAPFDKVLGTSGKSSAFKRAIYDETIIEPLFAENVVGGYSNLVGNWHTHSGKEGEIALFTMSDRKGDIERISVNSDLKNYLNYHGVDIPKNAENDEFTLITPKQFLCEALRDKLIKHASKMNLPEGFEYFGENYQKNYIENNYIKDTIDTALKAELEGSKSKDGDTIRRLVFDMDERKPVTIENIQDYMHLLNLDWKDILKIVTDKNIDGKTSFNSLDTKEISQEQAYYMALIASTEANSAKTEQAVTNMKYLPSKVNLDEISLT